MNKNVILLIEDEEKLSRTLAEYLELNGYEVLRALDGNKGLELFYDNMHRIDLVLLDIMLPGLSGDEVLKEIRKKSSTPVIMVTAKTMEIDMIKGLDMGADDYIKKPFSVMELITRVKAVLRRTMEVGNSKFITIGEVFLDNERHMVYVNDEAVELTFKEYELLKLLMANAGIVMTREMIMHRVWGTEFEGESRTVDMHIKTLRQKLGSSGSRIKTVRNVGYVME